MKIFKKAHFSYLSMGILTLFIILVTVLNFFDIFGSKFTNVTIYLAFFILFTLNVFKLALTSKSKGIITGLKIGGILVTLISALKIILKVKFTWWSVIYLSFILIWAILVAIYGANKKIAN